MGGARRSRTPAEGVLNQWNQAWDVKNLFVNDGAAMASCACQNPSITYMAFTARAVAHAVDELHRGAL
jgi:choline dehydrogenase-like flavoprotein